MTCVRCGQWVHDPENGRVCAECKAEDLAEEEREWIEFDQAFLDALNMIEISADCNGGNCWSAELLDRWYGRESLLIKALILAGRAAGGDATPSDRPRPDRADPKSKARGATSLRNPHRDP